MPKIEISYQQVLEAVKQFAPKEREQLEAVLREHDSLMDYPVFTAEDPLWRAVGAGKGPGGPAARHHNEYLYRKDW